MSDADNGNGDTFVRVTNREIWIELQSIKELVQQLPEDRKRIRSLELKVYSLLSGTIAAGVAFVLAFVKGGH